MNRDVATQLAPVEAMEPPPPPRKRDSEKPLLDTRQPEGVIFDPVARKVYEIHRDVKP